MKLYTLREKLTGFYPEVHYLSNGSDADYCGDTSTKLIFLKSPDNVWVVTSKEICLHAMTSTLWYNSDYLNPEHGLKEKDLEIVEFNL